MHPHSNGSVKSLLVQRAYLIWNWVGVAVGGWMFYVDNNYTRRWNGVRVQHLLFNYRRQGVMWNGKNIRFYWDVSSLVNPGFCFIFKGIQDRGHKKRHVLHCKSIPPETISDQFQWNCPVQSSINSIYTPNAKDNICIWLTLDQWMDYLNAGAESIVRSIIINDCKRAPSKIVTIAPINKHHCTQLKQPKTKWKWDRRRRRRRQATLPLCSLHHVIILTAVPH